MDTQHNIAFELASETPEGYCVPSPSDELSSSSHSIILESPPSGMDIVSPEEDFKAVPLIDIVSPEDDYIPTPRTTRSTRSTRSNTRTSHSEIASPDDNPQNLEFMSELKSELNAMRITNIATTSKLSVFTNHSSAASIGSQKRGADKVEGPRKRLIGSEQIDARPAKRLMALSPASTASKIRPPSQVRSIGATKRPQSIMTGTKKHTEGPHITLPSPLFASTHNQTSNPADINPINTSDHIDQALEHQSTSVPAPEHPNCNCHQMMAGLLPEIHGHLDRIAGILSHFQA